MSSAFSTKSLGIRIVKMTLRTLHLSNYFCRLVYRILIIREKGNIDDKLYGNFLIKVSRPGGFTPAPLKTVGEPLDSYGFRHPNLMA